ncbi:ribbon-helix-helix domain-containing protein [Azospirillum sp.]|uniref:ribbon-helix-helix domain-containing protein n=1 Tax=Azospirillum sp. TaxID=34012 RepID=UPI003D72431D
MQLERRALTRESRLIDLFALVSEPIMLERTLALTGGQTRLSLERTVWDGLDEAARREGRPVADLCGELDATKPTEVDLSTAIRTFVLSYYRQSSRV